LDASFAVLIVAVFSLFLLCFFVFCFFCLAQSRDMLSVYGDASVCDTALSKIPRMISSHSAAASNSTPISRSSDYAFSPSGRRTFSVWFTHLNRVSCNLTNLLSSPSRPSVASWSTKPFTNACSHRAQGNQGQYNPAGRGTSPERFHSGRLPSSRSVNVLPTRLGSNYRSHGILAICQP
jgi:hypothetical protein